MIEFVAKPKHRFVDLEGQTVGLLYVCGYVGSNIHRKAEWLCRCQCGNTIVRSSANLRQGSEHSSCGCVRIYTKKHGEAVNGLASPEYRAFLAAKGRCTNPNNHRYPYYGGRGIEFRFESFDSFRTEMGCKPSCTHSLDRIDNDGHYEKGNVRWATPKEQACNKSTSVLITHENVTKNISEWALEPQSRSRECINSRLSQGFCTACAIFGDRAVRKCDHVYNQHRLTTTRPVEDEMTVDELKEIFTGEHFVGNEGWNSLILRYWDGHQYVDNEFGHVNDVMSVLARLERYEAALVQLRDCDWVITLPDRMDAVRAMAREALKESK